MFRPWEDTSAVSANEVVPMQVNNSDNENVKKRQYLSTDAKQIVLNVYNSLVKVDKLSNSAAEAKASQLTLVPQTTIRRIVNTGVLERKKRCDSGTFQKITSREVHIIRQSMYSAYKKKEVPTIDSLRVALISEDIHCSRSTLWRVLKINGFKYKDINKRQVIMESSRICKWRYDYLMAIEKYRQEERNIYYLDETWYDTHDIVRKGWNDNSDRCKLDVPPSRGKRVIILHCGSANGWVEGAALLSAKNIKTCSLDYHQDMSATLFENWFENTLIPKLEANSVIVLDNAPYHSRLENKIPNSSSTKETIQQFLIANNIYFEDFYTKKQLLECMKSFEFSKEYAVDTIAQKYNHIVLRLPPYHCIFNPIELIWAQVKGNIRKGNNSPKFSETVIKLIKKELQGPSINAWCNAIRHVMEIEKSYIETVPDFVIHVNNNEDSSETDFDDDTDIYF